MSPKPISQDIKTPELERFDGTNTSCKEFFLQLKLVFSLNPSAFNTERTKSLYLVSLLKGPAFRWVAPYLENEDPILNDYEAFSRKLQSVFHQPEDTEGLMDELCNLRQGTGPVVAYAAKFRQFSCLVGWNEPPLIYFFKKGLSPKIREIIGSQEVPTSLEDVMAKAIRIDNSIKNPASEAPSQAHKPRQTQPTQAQKPAEQTDDLMSRWNQLDPNQQRYLYRGLYKLCHICGAEGHKSNDCPKRRNQSSNLKASGQSQQ
jgi:Ty3 transposon capsid-like protein/zinc knuckle protein